MANSTILFVLVGLIFGLEIAGMAVVLLCVYASAEFLVARSGYVRFPTPPFYALPDDVFPDLVGEWTKRLRAHGYERGQIAYCLDVSKKDPGFGSLVAVIAPGYLIGTPTLAISESVLLAAGRPTLEAMLEHEIGHLRSGTYGIKVFCETIALPMRMFLWALGCVRIAFEQGGYFSLAGKLYGCELYAMHWSSQWFLHPFECIADALAAQSLGSAEAYIEAMTSMMPQGEHETLLYAHDEHMLTHPSLESRARSLRLLFEQ